MVADPKGFRPESALLAMLQKIAKPGPPLGVLRRNGWGVLLAVWAGWLIANSASAASPARLSDVRLGEHPDHTRLVLELSDQVDYRIDRSGDSNQLAVNFPALDDTRSARASDRETVGIIAGVALDVSGANGTRLVIDLSEPAMVKTAFFMPPTEGKPYRFVLDLEKTEPQTAPHEVVQSATSANLAAADPSRIPGAQAPAADAPDTAIAGLEVASNTPLDLAKPQDAAVLKQQVAQRDLIILDLLNRVEALERQVAGAVPGQAPTMRHGAPGPLQAGADFNAQIGAPALPRRPVDMAQAGIGEDTYVDVGPGAPPPPPPPDEVDLAADRALERSLTQGGALLLMPGATEVEPSFQYIRRDQSGPLSVSGGAIATTRLRSNELQAAVDTRIGMPWDSQFEIGVPYRYVDLSNVSQNGSASLLTAFSESEASAVGFGDLNLGVAKTLLRENGWRPDLVARVAWDTDTGQSQNGISLGTGFNEVSASLIALKRQDPLALVGQLGYRSTFKNGRLDPGREISFSLGARLAVSPETSLNATLDQTFADELKVDGQGVPGSDQVSSVLSLGGSSVLGRGVLLTLTGGIGLTDDAPDYFVILSVPVRFDTPLLP